MMFYSLVFPVALCCAARWGVSATYSLCGHRQIPMSSVFSLRRPLFLNGPSPSCSLPSAVLGSHWSVFLSCGLTVLDISQVESHDMWSFLTYCHRVILSRLFILLQGRSLVFFCITKYHFLDGYTIFVYSFTGTWAFELFPPLGHDESCYSELLCTPCGCFPLLVLATYLPMGFLEWCL